MAASTYFDQVQQLYIAYFGRPADPAGLAYWAGQIDASNGSVAVVISGFASSNESNALYSGVPTAQKISAIYLNLFNRLPEPAGLAYWAAQLDSGAITQAQAAYQIQSSAGAGDAAAVGNKLAAAKAFTAQLDTPAEVLGYVGTTAAALARSFLTSVDATPTSLSSANINLGPTVAAATGTTVIAPTPTTPTAVAAFTATENTLTHEVAFGGTAAGDITLSWGGAVGASAATFSRGGNVAAPVTFGVGAATGLKVALTQTLVTSAANIAGLIISDVGSVKLTDTSLTAATLSTLNTAINPPIDATSLTALSGNYADIGAVKFSAGLTLSSTVNLTITDTGAVPLIQSLFANGTADALTLTGTTTNGLLNMYGFETINLTGAVSDPVFIASGTPSIVTVSKGINIFLGAGGQTFIGSAENDTVTGSIGNDTISAGGGTNTLRGEAGSNTFNVSGTDTISDLKTGDVLKVLAGGTAIATEVIEFNATAATSNAGTATITGVVAGSTINLSAATGSQGFTINGRAGNDTITGSAKADVITGGAGVNIYKFDAAQFTATTSAELITAADTITDWRVSGSNNTIDFTPTLTTVEHTAVALAGTAQISNGAAYFNSADTSLNARLDAVASAVGTDEVGTAVAFAQGSDTYLFVVGDATVGVQAGDALIKLSGVSATSMEINAGNITGLFDL